MRLAFWLITAILTIISNPLNAQEIDGGEIFKLNCKACHHMDMRLVGPALKDVHKRKDEEWLIKFIQGSQSIIQSGDPYAVALFKEYNEIIMPDQKFSDEELRAVLAYLKNESEAKAITAGAILRPEEKAVTLYKPLRFTSFTFWLPYTLAIFLLIALFYYLTDLTTIANELKAKQAGEESEIT